MTLPANYEQDIRRLLEANKFQYHHHHQQEQQQQRRCCLGIYSTLYSNENFIPCLSNQAQFGIQLFPQSKMPLY